MNEEEGAQARLERRRFHYNQALEVLRANIAFEHAALRPAYMLNGGALIVFLALFGTIITSDDPSQVLHEPLAIGAMVVWVLGLMGAVSSTVFGYYSQLAFRLEGDANMHARRFWEEGKIARVRGHFKEARKQGKCGQRQRRRAEFAILMSGIFFISGFALAVLSISPWARQFLETAWILTKALWT